MEKKEQDNKNLRIAIDFSIWQHQVQLGRGGTNADLRILFYRSLRLLRQSIEPLFVFDGPHKPPFKRNKKITQSGGSALQLAAIELFDLLGFPYITAPGEAEAECALLQKEGLVDAVLSEDVDTLMFGCTMHLRSWGPENAKSKGTATHVDVYRANEIKSGASGLDREGMVLVALMSGGDYLPAGIPNCGIKIACEAARAGFSSDLARIDQKDSASIRGWKQRLQHELNTNESKYFRTKHKTLEVPDNFPDRAAMYYYTNPVVSTSEQVQKYRTKLVWKEPDIRSLWQASRKFFNWEGNEGLRHFIRNLAPVLVGWQLANGKHVAQRYDSIDLQLISEGMLIKTISGRRVHPAADNIPELRLAYIPRDIVGLGPDGASESDVSGPQAHTAIYEVDEEGESSTQLSIDGEVHSRTRKRVVAPYDPTKIEKDWFPESYTMIGIPMTLKKWAAEENDPKKFATRKPRAREKEKEVMLKSGIENYFPKTKAGIKTTETPGLIQDGRAPALRKIYVPSKSRPSMDESLTKSVASTSPIITATTKTMQRSYTSIAKNSSTISTLERYTRVTKPYDERTAESLSKNKQDISFEDKFIELDTILSQSLANITKHARSLSPLGNSSTLLSRTLLSNRHEARPQKKTAPNLSGEVEGIPTGRSSLFQPQLSSDKASVEHVSATTNHMITSTHNRLEPERRRSPFTRTISAPNQYTHFKPRPVYNQWRSLDDSDTSFDALETPRKKNSIIVDLTLS